MIYTALVLVGSVMHLFVNKFAFIVVICCFMSSHE